MKVGYIQFDPIFGEKEKNFGRIKNLSKDIDADLIVLPELFATGYTFISKDEAINLAETIHEETFRFMKQLSLETDAVIVGGFAERSGEKIYNSSMVVFRDTLIGTYQKIHLFNKEKLWFSPGESKLRVFEVKNMKIGVMICFDWIFPEVARSLALQGADIIAHPSNLVLPYCQNAMKIRCLENRVFAVTTNRIGQEKRSKDEFNFTGKSQITSYDGDVLSRAPKDQSFVQIVDIDVNLARDKNLNAYNDLFKERKPKFYTLY